MRMLHTSDWHIGRTFHTHQTLDALREVLGAMARAVTEHRIDVVLVAGDVFDTAVPSTAATELLTETFRRIRAAGAQLVLTSGNHDSVVRLGYAAEWLALGGIHVLTRHETLDTPVLIPDAHGEVAVYGIPYLEPALLRHAYPDAELRTHGQALRHAMDRIRADVAANDRRRSVVLSHCFAAEVPDAATDVERDIVQGGVNLVSTEVFDGPDYVALGHIHGRQTITERVRYSGAPLHYSFTEGGKPRGGWIVDLDAEGLAEVTWLDLPVPRRLVELAGPLEQLLGDPRYDDVADAWVKVVLTDDVRPLDAMRRLQHRFPHCVALEFRPAARVADDRSYASRIQSRTDLEIVDGFLEHVRGGHGTSAFERELVHELLAQQHAEAATA